jgi:hypothetical protein
MGLASWLIDYTIGQMEAEFVIFTLDEDWF